MTCKAKAQRAGRKRRKLAARSVRIPATYGITLAEYDELLKHQGGVCAGCLGARTYNLHVDHDHQVEKVLGNRASVRGLLCKACNGVLNRVRDNPETLRRLAGYLERPPARGVIN